LSFLGGLLAGRSHLAFLVGLAAAAATAGAVRRVAPEPRPASFESLAPAAEGPRLRPHGPLDARERALARVAWSYLDRNTDPATGLATSVEGHPATTMWDLGSQLLGVLAAEDLGLVGRAGASQRLARALRSLSAIPLCDGLPNKAYDTRTLEMVAYDGRPAPHGIGWSALDVARVLLPLSVVAVRHPELAPAVRRTVSRWRLDALTDGGVLRGATRRPDGGLEVWQEGRLGYEQHAAKSLLAWGLTAAAALDYRRHVAFTRVDGQFVPRDARRPADHGGLHAPLVPEPWLLDAVERGLDAVTLPVARALLRAQEGRAAASGRLTAVSEDALDRPPWFSYSAIVDGDAAWTALGPAGAPADGALTFSTKAAVAWGVLFEGPYPERLLAAAAELAVPGRGLVAGRYDATWAPNRALSLNTNAVVLEALAYRVRGPIARLGARTDATALTQEAP
jgi:hypothetical protein